MCLCPCLCDPPSSSRWVDVQAAGAAKLCTSAETGSTAHRMRSHAHTHTRIKGLVNGGDTTCLRALLSALLARAGTLAQQCFPSSTSPSLSAAAPCWTPPLPPPASWLAQSCLGHSRGQAPAHTDGHTEVSVTFLCFELPVSDTVALPGRWNVLFFLQCMHGGEAEQHLPGVVRSWCTWREGNEEVGGGAWRDCVVCHS
jgi:hypothetical protein